MEEWRTIEGTNGNYEVSSTGKVRSNNYLGHGKTQELKQHYDKKGYLRVRVFAGDERITLKAHRAVAKAFIDNPKNLPEVNHINGIKDDNRVENLEWCSSSDNVKHAYTIGLKENVRKHAKKLGKTLGKEILAKEREKRKTPIKAIEISTGKVYMFSSQADAAIHTHAAQPNINKVLKGTRMSTNGYKFEYVNK